MSAAKHIAQALAHHRAGALTQAERLYRAVLDAEPENADALHLLGVAHLQGGDAVEAERLIRRALERAPSATVYCNLGAALRRQKRPAEAIGAFRRALALRPDYLEAHSNYTATLRGDGQVEAARRAGRRPLGPGSGMRSSATRVGDGARRPRSAARTVDAYRRALVGTPDDRHAWNNIGVEIKRADLSAGATAAFRRALLIGPLHAEAHANFGNELRAQEKPDAARAAYRRAAVLLPGFAAAYNNLGALQDQESPIAAGYCRRALLIQRDYSDAYYNLGWALKVLGPPERAEAALRRSLCLTPDRVGAFNNLAILLRDGGDADRAITLERRSLCVDPRDPESHLNLALMLMVTGAFAEGFEEYEWRWRSAALSPAWRPFEQPQWRGEPGTGGTLLLWSEQGLGDTLHFVRYLPMARSLGWRIVLEVPRALHRLVSSLDGEVVLVDPDGPLPAFDAHCPLLSLPRAFGTAVETIPAPVPYLHAEDGLREAWRARLPRDGYRVGIVWQGNPEGRIDRGRSYPLACAAPLARVPGVRLISLQKHHGLDQLGRLPAGMSVESLGDGFDAGDDAFLDTAAVAMELDLVVTSDTAVAHLAGALGRPVWLVLQSAPDWRWLTGREDTPWYPTMRLFRQQVRGDWDAVFARMAAELAAVVAGDVTRLLPPASTPQPALLPPIRIDVSPGELLDRIAALEIEVQRASEPARAREASAEHARLTGTAGDVLPQSPELSALSEKLRSINARLAEIEDAIRACEVAGDFGEGFAAHARAAREASAERAAARRAVDGLLMGVVAPPGRLNGN